MKELVDGLPTILKAMKDNGVTELKYGALSVKMASETVQQLPPPQEELKGFQEFMGKQPTDEEILMDPYTGLTGEGEQ